MLNIAVVIPARNEAKNIEKTIQSIRQIGKNADANVIIVVSNDGSKDNTLKKLKELKKEIPLIRILDKKNSGKAASINQAIGISKGELIVIVDSDSFPKKDKPPINL